MVEKNTDWGLGIVVHSFFVLLEVDQLAGRYFPICDDPGLDYHEEGACKFSSCPVTYGRGLYLFV